MAIIDIGINGRDNPYKGESSVDLVKHGEWKIDKVKGKTLCLVNIDASIENGDKLHLDFVPDDAFLYRFLDTFCEAEFLNDEFKFKHPMLKDRRPAQLKEKIRFLDSILSRWKSKLNDIENPKMF